MINTFLKNFLNKSIKNVANASSLNKSIIFFKIIFFLTIGQSLEIIINSCESDYLEMIIFYLVLFL